MENFHGQAQAIWQALDKMLAQDPDGYKRFISEQLQEGKSGYGKKDTPPSSSTSSKELESAFEKLSVGSGLSLGKPKAFKESKLRTGSSVGPKVPNKEVRGKTCQRGECEQMKREQTGPSGNSLLDGEIGELTSLITNIVHNPTDSECNNEDITLNELRIPTNERIPVTEKTKKPKKLIEEL